MIALIGGNGYVGKAFQQYLTSNERPFQVLSRSTVDYYDVDVLCKQLEALKPDFVINSAGFTGKPNVDACEIQKADCLQGNAVLPGIIRAACERLDLPWGHVSSGCIFTGTREDGNGFTEDDAPNFSFRQNNCSFYSGCKALGEEVLEDAQKCFIWRLRIPFNNIESPRNYLTKMIRYERLLNATNSLSHLGEFVKCCVSCFDQQVDFGTYNLTNPGAVTTREVVELIQQHKLLDRDVSFFESEEEFMQIAAKTPRSNCVLDSTKAVNAGLPLSPVSEVLQQSLNQWQTSEG